MICFLLIMSTVLYGCGTLSEEDAVQNAVNSAEGIFTSEEDIETNEQTQDFHFYLPEDLEIEEESKNNIILSDENEHYIVFYNNLESPTSKLNYESAKDSKSLAYESFEDESKFGYLQITPGTDENYQMQVGIGGVKITTYTTKSDLEEIAKELMKIARSITEGKKT